MLFGTVAGGAGSALTGGNFWQGAATGLIVSGLNHLGHDALDGSQKAIPKKSADEVTSVVPSGEIKFVGLTPEELSEFLIIPEDLSPESPLFAPTENKTYEGDGFYQKTFSNEKYWYKVSGGSRVTISKIGGIYQYNSYLDWFWSMVALARDVDYSVGWETKV